MVNRSKMHAYIMFSRTRFQQSAIYGLVEHLLTSMKTIELAQELDYKPDIPSRLLTNDGKANLLTALNIDDCTMRIIHDFGLPLRLHHINEKLPLKNLLTCIEHNWIPAFTVELYLRRVLDIGDLNKVLLIQAASDVRLCHSDIYNFLLLHPSTERIRMLVAAGYDLNSPRNANAGDYWTPLMQFCSQLEIELVKLLIEHGVNVNFEVAGQRTTALHVVAERLAQLCKAGIDYTVAVKIIRKLIAAGIDRRHQIDVRQLLKRRGETYKALDKVADLLSSSL